MEFVRAQSLRVRIANLFLALAAGLLASPLASLANVPSSRGVEPVQDAPVLDASGTTSLHGLELDVELGRLVLEDGLLFPVLRSGAPTPEMVFLGSGRLVLTPPDSIEEDQLELFTGSRTLDASFDAAVLVVTGDAVAAALGANPPATPPGPDTVRRAEEILTQWLEGVERKKLFVEGALFLDALGEPVMEQYFAGWFRGDEDTGNFVFSIDPDEFEQVTLEQFVPLELSDRGERKTARWLQSEHRRGRLADLELADLGTWDTWISAALRDPDGAPRPATAPFEPAHYHLEVTLDPERRLSAAAEVRMHSLVPGRRAVRMLLSPDLSVDQVTGADGGALRFVRSLVDLVVALPSPSVADEEVAIHVTYYGEPIEKATLGTYAQRSTSHWYPRTGSEDRATYDVTLHYPARYDLLASGRRMEQAEEDGKMKRERRVVDDPISHFSFEVGDFVIKEVQAGDVAVTVAFDRESTKWPPAYRNEILDTIPKALEFYAEKFGPYPLDYLNVVTAPRDFSQGFPGFVTLSDDAMATKFGRRHVLPHEIAHQWWGGLIGWRSYRDQWLSEAMANYVAVLYSRDQSESKSRWGPLSGWRLSLLRTTDDGRSVESLGPIVLGNRLDSSRYPAGYEAIVYDKGAMVLAMLARSFREDQFLDMLAHLARAARGQSLSTQEFLAAFEKMSGYDLSAFARQYVYGTGIPEVYYTYEFHEADEGGWSIKGEARQSARYRRTHRVVRTDSGRLDVASERIDTLEVESSSLVVPFQVLARAGREEAGSEPDKDDNLVMMSGRLPVTGERSTFTINSERHPIKFWLDKDGEVLAIFYSESREPKRFLLYEGIDQVAAGDGEAAEATLLRALDAPVFMAAETEEIMASREKRAERVLDCRIHLELARLYLDEGRDAEAVAALKAVDKLMDPFLRMSYGMQWDLLRSREEIRRGEFGPTFKRFRLLPRRYSRPPTEALLLLAIAAGETGHPEDRQRAIEMAEHQGANVELLR